jgi:predicted Zn-ribbon and HTH transcriptional regulator
MSLYEMVKDAANLAQKADNIELVRKLLDVQNIAIEMQEKQLILNTKIEELNNEIKNLKEMKRIIFAEGEKYLIDPAFPDRPLCPVCTRKFGYEVPMYNRSHCSTCKKNF